MTWQCDTLDSIILFKMDNLTHFTLNVTPPFCVALYFDTHKLMKQIICRGRSHVSVSIPTYTTCRPTIHWDRNTHTQIKGFMGSGWWRANGPEEMEEAHQGEWWEEMMRMMSAECLASGTDLVRLSAKRGGRPRERWQEREIKLERAGERRWSMSKYYYPVTTKVSLVLFSMTTAPVCDCAASLRLS